MKLKCVKYIILTFFVLWLHSPVFGFNQERDNFRSVSNGVLSIKIIPKDEFALTVLIMLRNDFSGYIERIFSKPKRLSIDIFTSSTPFKTLHIPFSSPILKDIRAGYHPDRIRVVMGLINENIIYRIKRDERKIIVLLGDNPENRVNKKKHKQETEAPSKTAPLVGRYIGGSIKKIDQKDINNLKSGNNEHVSISIDDMVNLKVSDKNEESKLFLSAISSYRESDFNSAIESLTKLIRLYPRGEHSEYAYYLRARVYDRIYSSNEISNLNKVKEYYEEAMLRYPDSKYLNDALFHLAIRNFQAGNKIEALAYINRILKKRDYSTIYHRALLLKAKILVQKKRIEDAIELIKGIIQRAEPNSREGVEARIELAKLYYKMNSFRASLKTINEIEKFSHDAIYRYSEIALYKAYNNYQLENMEEARNWFFYYYNVNPYSPETHLILTRIGDTYREEGKYPEAIKLYNSVIHKFPDSEGYFISLIRIAEIQEEGKWPDGYTVNGTLSKPYSIYKMVIQKLEQEKKENPLIQLALLKLAILYQNKLDYEKSLKTIKKLLNNFPKTSLRIEAKYTLEKSLKSLFKKLMNSKQHKRVINIYEKDKDLILTLDSPEILLTVARSYILLNDTEKAIPLYKKTLFLLSEDERPPDLIFYMGKDAIKRDQIEEAIKWFNYLSRRYPESNYSYMAYEIIGNIFYEKGMYRRAEDMFLKTLNFEKDECKKFETIYKLAKSFFYDNKRQMAYRTLKQLNRLSCDSYKNSPNYYLEKGNILIDTGHIKEAIDSYSRALSLEDNESIKSVLRFKLSRCYEMLDQNDKANQLLKEIALKGEPFWAMIAKEKLKDRGVILENKP